MNTITIIVAGTLALMLAGFTLRLTYVIMKNLIDGRKFHQNLEQEFNRLRLSRMLTALGINKSSYIHQTSVSDIHQQMESCSACKNTDECDEKLAKPALDVDEIEFCNNESRLQEIKQQQKTEASSSHIS